MTRTARGYGALHGFKLVAYIPLGSNAKEFQMPKRPIILLAGLAIILAAHAGCSSDNPSQEEQSKVQSEVLSEHFKAKLPESRKKK
jgi:hypothetical protein